MRTERPTLDELFVNPGARKAFDDASAALEAGRLIRALREAAGLTQAEMAERMGVSQARISALEMGDKGEGPTYGTLKRVAAACGVDWPGAMTAPSRMAARTQVSAADIPGVVAAAVGTAVAAVAGPAVSAMAAAAAVAALSVLLPSIRMALTAEERMEDAPIGGPEQQGAGAVEIAVKEALPNGFPQWVEIVPAGETLIWQGGVRILGGLEAKAEGARTAEP